MLTKFLSWQGKDYKKLGIELGQAQLKLERGFTLIKICCIE